MSQAYANQILGIALAMSAMMFIGVWIASRVFDRNTRRLDSHRGD